MVKFLLITFNAILFFIISLFGKVDGIGISGNFPTTMKPGSEAIIELKVKKGSMGGFAKLQLDVPEGFSATEIDSKGSNFSFTPGLIKWVWPALPTEDEVIVKFKLVADAGMSGVKTVGGKFSYVENNAKQVVDMAPVDINITNEEGQVAATPPSTETKTTEATPTPTQEPVAETKTTAPATTQTPTQTPITETKTTTETTTPPPPSLNDEPAGSVTVLRYIKAGSNPDEHLIEMKVSKGSIRGFAKFSDELPAGYTAKAVKTSESSFSVADGKIKFVWVTLPADEEIVISYLLSGRSASMVELKGEFSYLANDQSKKFVMQTVTLPNTPSGEPIANNTPTTTETPTVASTPTTSATPTETTQAVTTYTESPSKPETPTNTEKSTKVGEIDYRVQIGAFSNANVSAQTLKRKFGVSGDIISEMHGGLNKFMIGSYNEYKGAKDRRDQIRGSIASAFVVAYNGSKRITVQEALMLTNQKWFK